MRIQSFLTRISMLSVALLTGVSVVSAQSYYDDDIYYDASKAPKKTEKMRRPEEIQMVPSVQVPRVKANQPLNIIMMEQLMFPGIM